MATMADETTINVRPATRDKIREVKGFDRTYDEILSEWVDYHAADTEVDSRR